MRSAEAVACGSTQEAFDFLFALFTGIFQMRDWISASCLELNGDVSVLFRASAELALVRDLANGSKHMTLGHYSVDGAATVAREYAGGGMSRFTVPRPGGRNIEAMRLADTAIAEVRAFMEAKGLL